MKFGVYLLSFLIFILIAIIVSKKIRLQVKSIVEFIFKAIYFIFLSIGYVIIAGVIIGLIKWGWDKSHQIYPEMWSLQEIVGVILCGAFFIFLKYLYKKYDRSNRKNINLERERIIKRELCILAFFLIVMTILTIPLGNFIFCYFILWLSYPFYLFIRFIIWATKTLRKK